jgi:myo-inositol-1(or 4)-monophosphatase
MLSTQEISNLIPHVRNAVLTTGEFIRREKKDFTRSKAEIKGVNDLVSYVDRTAEMMLSAAFENLIPGSGFINEEGGTTHADRENVWIIDPLDGTTNFVYGIPIFSISVALQHKGTIVLGMVYEVNRDELFEAGLGLGAKLNSEPIHVSGSTNFAQCLVATGYPFQEFDRIDDYMEILKKFMSKTKGIRRLGSAAVDLAFTACGRFDGYFESNLNPWDVAAGSLLVTEAGGIVTDYRGGSDFVFGRSIVAGAPAIQAEMLSIVEGYRRVE